MCVSNFQFSQIQFFDTYGRNFQIYIKLSKDGQIDTGTVFQQNRQIFSITYYFIINSHKKNSTN